MLRAASGTAAGLDGSASPVKRKRKKTDAYVHIGTTEEFAGGMSDKDRRELECEKVHAVKALIVVPVYDVCSLQTAVDNMRLQPCMSKMVVL